VTRNSRTNGKPARAVLVALENQAAQCGASRRRVVDALKSRTSDICWENQSFWGVCASLASNSCLGGRRYPTRFPSSKRPKRCCPEGRFAASFASWLSDGADHYCSRIKVAAYPGALDRPLSGCADYRLLHYPARPPARALLSPPVYYVSSERNADVPFVYKGPKDPDLIPSSSRENLVSRRSTHARPAYLPSIPTRRFFVARSWSGGVVGDARERKIQPEVRAYPARERKRVTVAVRSTVGCVRANYGQSVDSNALTVSRVPAHRSKHLDRDIQRCSCVASLPGGSGSNRATRPRGRTARRAAVYNHCPIV